MPCPTATLCQICSRNHASSSQLLSIAQRPCWKVRRRRCSGPIRMVLLLWHVQRGGSMFLQTFVRRFFSSVTPLKCFATLVCHAFSGLHWATTFRSMWPRVLIVPRIRDRDTLHPLPFSKRPGHTSRWTFLWDYLHRMGWRWFSLWWIIKYGPFYPATQAPISQKHN